jgi:hypothetical protein
MSVRHASCSRRMAGAARLLGIPVFASSVLQSPKAE